MNALRFALLLGLVSGAGCASSGSSVCTTSSDCDDGFLCIDDTCVRRSTTDAGPIDAAPPPVDGGSADAFADGGVDLGPPPMCATAADCDDSSLCTTDECVGGSCQLTPVVCDDGDACTDDGCDPASGCTTTPTDCDDGDACTVDSCDSATGCAHEPLTVPGGSCASPIDISAGGTFTGSSSCAASDFSGVCGGGAAPDVAFVLDLATPSMVRLDAGGSSFALSLFVGSTCGSDASGCNASGTANLNVTLPAGRHFVGLDGLSASASGDWSLAVGITPVVSEETVTFPAVGDTRSFTIGDRPWNSGDFIEGTRATSLSSITSAQLNLAILPNGLTCDDQDMRLRINGTVVGSVIVSPGATSVTPTFTFAPISGPTYTLRLETVRTVSSGCGSAGVPDGSTIVLGS